MVNRLEAPVNQPVTPETAYSTRAGIIRPPPADPAPETPVADHGLRRAPWLRILLAVVATTNSLCAETTAPVRPDTIDQPQPPTAIPFRFRRGHLLVPARVNGSPPLAFVLDTGYGVTTLNPDQVDRLRLKRVGQMVIDGIAGEETASVFSGATFDFGDVRYTPPRIAALPSDREPRARYRDGVLGQGLFRRFVVEIDPQSRTLRLQAPQSFVYSGPGTAIDLTLRHGIPVAEATILRPDRPPVTARFEIDTGCDGGLCLGHDFVTANQLLPPDESTRHEVREGVGGEAMTRAGRVWRFQLGKFTVDNAPANFFLKGSPADEGLAGHVGLEILRQFKVIFDYSRRRLILEPIPWGPAATP